MSRYDGTVCGSNSTILGRSHTLGAMLVATLADRLGIEAVAGRLVR